MASGPDLTAAPADFDSLAQAADWYAALRGEDATEADRRAWRDWLAQRPENADAWRHIEAVGRKFDPLRLNGARPAALAGVEAAHKAARSTAAGRRRALNGLAGALGAGLLGWLGWRHTPLPRRVAALEADYRTGMGEQRSVTLADGSTVWLNTDSALDVRYGSAERALALLGGEILVQTAPDPALRPFYVATRLGRMQALGTRFAVRLAADHVRLDVFEGAVQVVNAAGASRRVEAGMRVRFDAAAIADAGPADRAREAWSRGVVLADNIPLRALVEELGRYRHGHISLAPEVAGLNAMGVYPAGDSDRALAMLEQSLPIRVRRPLPWWTSIEARRDGAGPAGD